MPRDIHVPALDLSRPRRIHIVGVGGAGMSAIALLLVRMGHTVSGSDIKGTTVLERLAAAGIDVRVGNRAEHVPPDADAVVYSTAVPRTNVELRAADDAGIAVLHRSHALAAIAAIRKTVAIAGSHGKTTTASMLALVLRAAGWEPSFVIGADVNEVGANAAYGAGEWFVVEADESDGSFLRIHPYAAVVTNVEPDHLSYYGGFPGLIAAFEEFADDVAGPRVFGADDLVASQLAAARPRARTFGHTSGAYYRIVDERVDENGCRFTLTADGAPLGQIAVPVGVRAASNGAAAAAIALELGVPFDAIAGALAGFGGVARRFQFRGERDGVTFIDDYAHLPTEVAAAIETARSGPWRRIIAVFQHHRYSRTATIGSDFGDAFTDADAIVLTDVYPAGETPVPGVTGHVVLNAVLDHHPGAPVTYLPRRADLHDVPRRMARAGDVVLTLGAGDLTTMPDVWLGATDVETSER